MSRMLSFTPDVLFRLFEQYNAAFWPLVLVAYGLVVALFAVSLAGKVGPPDGHWQDRIAAAILAGFWLWTGIVFHGLYFSGINFIAPLYAALFVLQAFLLGWTGVLRGRLSLRVPPAPLGWAGLVLVLLTLFAYAVAGYMAGHGWERASLLLPTPLALFTLMMMCLSRGRAPLNLAVVPFVWCLIAGMSGSLLDILEDLIPPFMAITAVATIAWKNRRPELNRPPTDA